MKRRGLLNKHFCKKEIQNIPNETEKIVNFLFSHYKSMGTISCHSNQAKAVVAGPAGPASAGPLFWPNMLSAVSLLPFQSLWRAYL